MKLQQNLTTREFAAFLKVKPDTVRHSLCINGHYMGVKPIKLPNRMLLWPADAYQQLVAGEKVEV